MAVTMTHQSSMDAADKAGIINAAAVRMPVTESRAGQSRMPHAVYASVGAMAMPADFRYKSVHLKGRPRHEKYSAFWCRHIPMDCARRAKIFVAFDALKGFDEAIEEVQRQSENKKDVETCAPDIM